MYSKIIRIVLVITLLCFSFYYTSFAVKIIKNSNPIMTTIKKEKENYEKEAVNAIVEDDEITPGIAGVTVNVDSSFNKMFNYGEYNTSLYVFDETTPTVSINNYYNKYITSGRSDSMNVSLIFTVDRNSKILDLLTTLSDMNTPATFFIDGLFLENNRSFVLNMIEEGYEVELLSYNGNYQEIYFKNALDILNELKGSKSSYCFSDYKKYKVLNLCKKLELHTVIPTINAKVNTYSVINKKLSGGSIIRLSNKIEPLPTSINYIKQRGYNLVRLDKLLSE